MPCMLLCRSACWTSDCLHTWQLSASASNRCFSWRSKLLNLLHICWVALFRWPVFTCFLCRITGINIQGAGVLTVWHHDAARRVLPTNMQTHIEDALWMQVKKHILVHQILISYCTSFMWYNQRGCKIMTQLKRAISTAQQVSDFT